MANKQININGIQREMTDAEQKVYDDNIDKTNIQYAIARINPKAKFEMTDASVDNINWIDETTPISKSDIDAKISRVDLDNALDELREKRNNLLAETDWMANSDVTMSDDWKTYRQELRDLPSGLDTVEKVNAKEFPTKPSE